MPKVSIASQTEIDASRNFQKHTNPNRLHQWLLRRFHKQVTRLVAAALDDLGVVANHTQQSPVVVDVGCGEGFVAAHLSKQFPGIRLLGVEQRPSAVGYAKDQGIDAANWLAADVCHLPLGDASVPIVLCLEVLEHLSQPLVALQELQRVCSGALILSVPNQPFFALANLLRGKNLRNLGDDPEHISHWRAATFLRLVRSAVEVDRVAYAFPWVIVMGKPRGRPKG